MKIFIFFFVFLFSSIVSAETTICIGDGCPTDVPVGASDGWYGVEVNAVYDPVTGTTSFERVDTTANTPGVWNPKTFSCTNYVNPVADSVGAITCPARATVGIAPSTTAPNPSKDDAACDPSIPVDPLHPELGCASQKTAIETNKLISESNSKLGSIASSNATNSGLLGGILGTLKDISAQGGSSDCPPSGSAPLSCPDGQVTGYFNHQFTCVSSSGISCTGDECRTAIVSSCGVIQTGTGTGKGTESSLSSDTKDVSVFTPAMTATGSCPADISIQVLKKTYSISYKPICSFAKEIRGVVITIGAFSALLIVVTAL